MWIKAASQVTENVYQVTTPVSSHFLVCGEFIGITDSGISALSGSLVDELATLFGEERTLDYIFLTHGHYDHVGGVAALRQVYPKVKVIASTATADRLSDETVLREAYDWNEKIGEAFQNPSTVSWSDWKKLLRVDQTVNDGDSIDLGDGVMVKVVMCPGHTKEQTAYFVPSDGALYGGEAFGFYNGRGKMFPTCGSGYNDYLSSIEKAAKLEVKALGFPHNGTLTGELAHEFLLNSQQETVTFYQAIKDRIASGELVDEIIASIIPDWRVDNVCPEGPFVSEQEEALRRLVKCVAAE